MAISAFFFLFSYIYFYVYSSLACNAPSASPATLNA